MGEIGEPRQVPGAGLVPADVREDPGALVGRPLDPGARTPGVREATAARAWGGFSASDCSGGAAWPCETIVRSPSYAMETVTGECQPRTVREVERSMPSPCSRASQQYSP